MHTIELEFKQDTREHQQDFYRFFVREETDEYSVFTHGSVNVSSHDWVVNVNLVVKDDYDTRFLGTIGAIQPGVEIDEIQHRIANYLTTFAQDSELYIIFKVSDK